MILHGEKGNYNIFVIHPNGGDYRSILIKDEGKTKLELRVSGTAISNESCGLNEDTVHDWLMDRGLEIITQMDDLEVTKVLLTSTDIDNAKITTNWRTKQVGE